MSTIRVPASVERLADDRFVARADVKLAAEGRSPDEALARLQAEAVPAEPPAPLEPLRPSDGPNPWVAMAGAFKGDPLMAEWRQAMADRRAELAARELDGQEGEAEGGEEPT